MANETPSRPAPLMANAILNFHFDFPHPSLIDGNSVKREELVAIFISLQIFFSGHLHHWAVSAALGHFTLPPFLPFCPSGC